MCRLSVAQRPLARQYAATRTDSGQPGDPAPAAVRSGLHGARQCRPRQHHDSDPPLSAGKFRRSGPGFRALAPVNSLAGRLHLHWQPPPLAAAHWGQAATQ